jgi:thioredoxin-related protein
MTRSTTQAIVLGIAPILLGIALLFIAPIANALELIYIHSDGCLFCQKFKAEVGETGYRARLISTAVPMVVFDVEKDYPEGYVIKPIQYTPTFILVDDGGNEVGRFIGYNNPESFFRRVNTLVTEYEETQ